MKLLLKISLIYLCIFNTAFSITVKPESFGDVKIYITPIMGEADLIVYEEKDFPEHDKEEIWQYVSSFPDLKIKMTQFKGEANLIVYFASTRGEAGWKNNQHSLKGKLKR